MIRLVLAALLAGVEAAQGPIAGAGVKQEPRTDRHVERQPGYRPAGGDAAPPLALPAPALLAAWVYAVDPSLGRSIAWGLEPLTDGAGPQQTALPLLLLIIGCAFNVEGCGNDAVARRDGCKLNCADECEKILPPGSQDYADCKAVCDDCCNHVHDTDMLNCTITCGVDRPEQEDYSDCYGHVWDPSEPIPWRQAQ